MKSILNHKIRIQVIATTILGTLTLMLGSNVANAVTVYFNDADRGPSDVLQIGGITITDTGTGTGSPVGQPTTVQGVGLGFHDGVGLAGEVDEQAYWPAGESGADSVMGGEGLFFQVDGYINSITIMPVMRIFSSTGGLMPIPNGLYLEFTCSPLLSGGPYPEFPANTSTPITLTVDDIAQGSLPVCYLTPQMDWSPDYWFSGYRQDSLSEEQTLQWGFTVVSLDYTPVPGPGAITFVPEPSTITFLAIGLTGLLFARRERWSHCSKRSCVTENVP
jgi:hypothetical protein